MLANPVPQNNQSCTLAQWLSEWFETYKKPINRTSTLKKQLNLINIINTAMGTLTLNEITAIQIQQYINSITAPRQREHIYVLLKDALKKAYDSDLIAKNIANLLVKPSHQQQETVALLDTQTIDFLNAIDGCKYALFYKIMLYEGLRCGEVLGLKHEDIDIVNKTICVSCTRDRLGIRPPKTRAGMRKIPIFDVMVDELTNLVNSNIKTANQYIFDIFEYSKVYQDICAKCKIVGTTTYTLRHTFATNCARKNIAPKVLQKWLGHSDINMALKYYIHVNQEWETKEIEKYNN